MTQTSIYTLADLQAWRDAIDAWLTKSATTEQLATLKRFEGVDIGHVAIAVAEETVSRFNHAIWCTLTEYAWEEDESQAFADLALCYLEPVKNPGRTLEECEADVERARATLIECLDRQKERQVDAPPPADPALLALANRALGEQLAEAQARIASMEKHHGEVMIAYEAASNALGGSVDTVSAWKARTEKAEFKIESNEASFKREAARLVANRDEWMRRAEKAEGERDALECTLDAVNGMMEQSDKERDAALADNAALTRAAEALVIAVAVNTCLTTEKTAELRASAGLGADHPGAALLQELTALRAVARRVSDAVKGGWLRPDDVLVTLLASLDALGEKAAADA